MRLDDTGPGGRLSGEAEDRAGAGPRPHRSGLDRRPRRPQPRPRLPGQHGHLPVQPQDAGRRAGARPTTAISARRSFRPRCARTTCRSICSTAIGKTSARSSRFTRRTWQLAKPNAAVRLWRRPSAPIYTQARFLPPSRIDGATIRGSLVADGSLHRGRGRDRKQRRSACAAASAATSRSAIRS